MRAVPEADHVPLDEAAGSVAIVRQVLACWTWTFTLATFDEAWPDALTASCDPAVAVCDVAPRASVAGAAAATKTPPLWALAAGTRIAETTPDAVPTMVPDRARTLK